MGKIVVVGSINMDYTALVKDLPLPGETLLAKGFQMSGVEKEQIKLWLRLLSQNMSK
jgi:hypothetical protein